MAKIVANFFISLDGVVESPEKWHFPYFDDAMGQVVGAAMQGNAGTLMGRRLYDEWSAYFPAQSPDDPIAAAMNSAPKYVVTSRPIEGERWNNTTVLSDDPVAQLRRLKDELDAPLAMSGSATTVRFLLEAGLLDELVLLVHPIVVGEGAKLFDGLGTTPLTVLSSQTLPSGVVHVRYAPKES